MHSRRLVVAIFVALVPAIVLASCHRASQGAAIDQPQTVEPVMLEVENHNWSDIIIYILHDGRKHRLASVTAAKDLSIPIPPNYHGETGVFRLIVNRIGGRDSYTSEPISIRTGSTVRLTVESALARSSVGVW